MLCQPVQTTMCSEATGGYLHPVYQIDPTQHLWKK